MKTAIAQIRTLAAKPGRTGIPITVTNTDLPTNDGRRCFKQFSFHPTAIWRVSNVFCSPLWQRIRKVLVPLGYPPDAYLEDARVRIA
jgi:hypothetical protein